MKRKILVLSSLLVLFVVGFFYYLNKRIEGTWIRHYSTDLKDQNFRYDGKMLVDIENQKFNSYSFGFNQTPGETNYFDFGASLKLWPLSIENNSSYAIGNVHKDSLVLLEYGLDKTNKAVFKKISDTLKNNSDWNRILLGKVFEFRLSEFTDTIYFDEQFIMNKNLEASDREWSSQGWGLAKIKGFDVMFTGNWTTFFLKENDGRIMFYGFDNKKQLSKAELREININLSGVKRMIDRIKQQGLE